MKSDFSIKEVSKKDCCDLLRRYHYLSKIQNGFKSGKNYGLIKNNQVVGVCIFTGLPVPELAVGMFGLQRHEQNGLYELSRLVIHPDVQKTEHNIAGWFAARCIKDMQKNGARAILSYADSEFHNGTIYKALGFGYYGLTEKKKDFFKYVPDLFEGNRAVKMGRGKDIDGQWIDRSQKHRFLKVFDKNLSVKWEQIKGR